MIRFIINAILILPSAAIAYVVGTVVATQFSLNTLNVPITLSDRVETAMFDLTGMHMYFVVILIAFIIAFAIASVIKGIVRPLAFAAYPIAGASGILTALGLMYAQFGIVPISGAQSTLGLIAQAGAGAIGGLAYSLLVRR